LNIEDLPGNDVLEYWSSPGNPFKLFEWKQSSAEKRINHQKLNKLLGAGEIVA